MINLGFQIFFEFPSLFELVSGSNHACSKDMILRDCLVIGQRGAA